MQWLRRKSPPSLLPANALRPSAVLKIKGDGTPKAVHAGLFAAEGALVAAIRNGQDFANENKALIEQLQAIGIDPSRGAALAEDWTQSMLRQREGYYQVPICKDKTRMLSDPRHLMSPLQVRPTVALGLTAMSTDHEAIFNAENAVVRAASARRPTDAAAQALVTAIVEARIVNPDFGDSPISRETAHGIVGHWVHGMHERRSTYLQTSASR